MVESEDEDQMVSDGALPSPPESDTSDHESVDDDVEEDLQRTDSSPQQTTPEPRMTFHENDFVITEFKTEEDHRSRFYLGKIMKNVGLDKSEVSYLRKKKGLKGPTHFTFPDQPDVCETHHSNMTKVKAEDMRRNRFVIHEIAAIPIDSIN
ncbi:hypothetical protein GE061_011424 [Apolygus lucorum]|uniref:Uncharacterized protein n=1 Tax=Apolygus lucorum TaxID=248454 RepID=A0A8S9XXA0_APOLU|nr:hypothetical protein GE061_011424 [Apolygus lucorum]